MKVFSVFRSKKCFCLICLFFITNSISLFAQKTFDRERYLEATEEFKTVLTHELLLKYANAFKKYHPYDSDSIDGKSFKEIIDAIDLPKEAMTSSEFVFHIRKFFDYMTEEDPHVGVLPKIRQPDAYKVKLSMIKVPPFWGLLVNDTLLVHRSLNDKLEKGDRVLSINNIPLSVLLNYNYKRTYLNMGNVMYYYNYNVSDTYKITLQRDNLEMEVEVEGISYDKYGADRGIFCESKIYNEQRVGYFKIQNFDNNRKTFKKLNSFCKNIKKEGISNLIIDLRENPGGSGDMLDSFFSLFCSSDSISLQNSSFIRVSKVTLDYGFTSSELGKLLPMPEEYMYRTVPLNSDYYLGKINLYVLISECTASTAASFANVIQFNDMGILVGESLEKNALKYGEIDLWNFHSCKLVLSTVVFDEHTRAKDGIVNADISIPYIAKEYMQDDDPMLEELLEIIDKKQ